MISAIIGLLATIALPKFGNMIIKSKEAALLGSLGALRSAYTIYYADTEGIRMGMWSINNLTVGNKYIDAIPKARVPTIPAHRSGSAVTILDDISSNSGLSWAAILDSNLRMEQILVNCTHNDSKGNNWSAY